MITAVTPAGVTADFSIGCGCVAGGSVLVRRFDRLVRRFLGFFGCRVRFRSGFLDGLLDLGEAGLQAGLQILEP